MAKRWRLRFWKERPDTEDIEGRPYGRDDDHAPQRKSYRIIIHFKPTRRNPNPQAETKLYRNRTQRAIMNIYRDLQRRRDVEVVEYPQEYK